MAVNIKFPILGGSCGKVFVQRWMELLHPLTMDTYAAKLLNSHLALKETCDIIEQVMIKQVTYFIKADSATP